MNIVFGLHYTEHTAYLTIIHCYLRTYKHGCQRESARTKTHKHTHNNQVKRIYNAQFIIQCLKGIEIKKLHIYTMCRVDYFTSIMLDIK